MTEQSTRHLLMIEPAVFYANPETMSTNIYQVDEREPREATHKRAQAEFRTFRNKLVENGVIVTTAYGHEDCPDMVFPNGISTHEDGRLVIYPMFNANRRPERTPEIINFLKMMYPDVVDLTHYEGKNLFLEARGSLVCDRVNRVAYAGLSKRTSRELVEKWGEIMGYEVEIFETMSHTGQPVYHTDLVMYVGSTMAGVCAECIADKDRARVMERLRASHDVVEFSMQQLAAFCGNALEVKGSYNDRMLAMSEVAHKALLPDQLAMIEKHFKKILRGSLPTLEKYGGGSARCMLMELY
jgi:hypothetical protein